MLLNLLAILLLVPLLVDSAEPAFNDDVLGLIVFKSNLGDPEAKLSSWSEDDDDPCNWVGVKCDPKTNRVSELLLDGFSLSGHIGRSLLRLQFLRVLSLSRNNFTGTINPSLSQFESLRVMDLSDNNLSGSIPDDLFRQCRSLRAISLGRNNLSGQIPGSLSSCFTLVRVNFSTNHLSGSLPSGIWSLGGLRSLDLSDNLLEGEIPHGIESLYDLRAVNLRRNKFIGQLPLDIGGCLLLKSLDLGENSFSGSLPESMRKLSLCSSLNVGRNLLAGEVPDWIGEMKSLESLDLSGNNFSGQIPNSIGDLHLLKELNLSMNGFTESLPESLTSCVNLLALDVSNNALSGILPPWIFRLGLRTLFLKENKFTGRVEYPPLTSMAASYASLQILDLSSNSLSGEMPSATGKFSALKFLNMSRNFLIGSIPVSIGELKTIESLDLSFNQLNGNIPSEIGGLVSLHEISLEHNLLAGKIPSEIENCSSLTTLILSKNNLTGSLPVAISNLTDLQIIDLSFNNLSGTLPKELTNLTHLLIFNISHNHIQGELPVGGFFNTIPLSSVSGNPSLCGSILNQSCPAVHPKPIVLNPNSSSNSKGNSLSANLHHKRIVLSISALVAISAAVFITLGVIIVTVLNLHVRSSMAHAAAAFTMSHEDEFSHSPTNESTHGKLVMFSGDAGFVAGAQALLNKECEIGRGGFGTVYKTVLQDGHSMAIKKLNVSSLTKSQEDFEREVKKLGKIRHPNLVALEGYYWTSSLQLIINEYVSGGSLYKHLHEEQSQNCLSWQQRFNIILGTAKGLACLHEAGIIHYNIKSTNVLINNSGEPSLGDFGLARLLPMLDRCILSSKIQSALGYMAPEFACRTVKITEKSDIYGFGILILEVVTGKRPVEYMEDDVVVLCDMVRRALEESKVEECVDGRLSGNFPAEEAVPVIKLGLICASQVPSNRPDMGEVVKILELIQCPSGGEWV
ncbi:Non-specific serine/threonine protein kinase [Bertholletia excelsa]